MQLHAEQPAPPLPVVEGGYQIILADPPWRFATYSDKGKSRSAERHYGCMALDAIKALPVAAHAARDAVLYLWVTCPFAELAYQVVHAWGFTYKSQVVWVKTTADGAGLSVGTGYYYRGNAELLYICTRGKGLPRLSHGEPNVILSPRREHSRKPDEQYSLVNTLYGTDYRRLEMFARQPTPGWETWGLESHK